jgi:hypothetical protein
MDAPPGRPWPFQRFILGRAGMAQYGEGWLKITARLTIFASLMPK